MRSGKITQTIWKRSVGKQLNIKAGKDGWNPGPFEACSALHISEGISSVQADSCACGNAGSGYFAVLQAAGELAGKGVKAENVSVRVLLPVKAEEEVLKQIACAVEEASSRMHMRVSAFQGEVSPAVRYPVIYAAASGAEPAEKRIRAVKGAGAGEREILFCGYTGLEGTLRILELAGDELSGHFVPAFLGQIAEQRDKLVMPDRLVKVLERTASESGPVSVRQVGSGGFLASLWELSEELETGFEVSMSAAAIRQETVEVCEFYRLNPYQMTSAGSFLLVTEDAELLIRELEKEGIRAGRLGVTRAQNARVITSGAEKRYLDRPAPDELIRWMSERSTGAECL